MTFLKQLAQSVGCPASIWHQFVVSHDPKRDDWYIFVEGQLDTAFYTSALRQHVSPSCRILGFRCAGKAGVFRAHNAVRNSHAHCTRTLFFVDKDIDDLLGVNTPPLAPDLFCTSVYSIENYLVTAEALEVTWTQVWAMPADDPSWPHVQAKYSDALAKFQKLLTPVMAWILLARFAGCRPNVNNVNLSGIVRLVDCEPRLRRSSLTQLIKETSCEYRPALKEWLRTARVLRGMNPKDFLRGKFEIWMFSRFLSEITSALCERDGQTPRRSIPPSIDGIAISLLGKVSTPTDLTAFLTRAVQTGAADHCPDAS